MLIAESEQLIHYSQMIVTQNTSGLWHLWFLDRA
jgi:hypothetical protein